MKQIHYLIFLIPVIFFSCKKTEEPRHYRVTEEFKHWGVFNKGSYWIFRNDSTLILDSIFITHGPEALDVPDNSSTSNYTYEYITTNLFSSFLISYIETASSTETQALYNGPTIMILSTLEDEFISSYSTGTGKYFLVSKDSVVYINSQKFNTVIHTQRIFGDKKYNYWIARDIGVIKYSGENTNPAFLWSLVRYHIVK
jgi:hypothetical protein